MLNQHSISAIDQQLLTDVQPEQAAMVEGGLQRVQLLQLRCLSAGADADGSDEVFASFNGVDANFGTPRSMRKGSVANFGVSGGSSGRSIRVALFDKDGNNRSAADFLGSFTVTGPVGNPQTRIISANGSRYEVSFTAF